MDQTIKNIFGVVVILLIVTLIYGTMSYVSALQRAPDVPSFTVTGEGEVVVVPDIARFSFGVVSRGGIDVSLVQAENAKATNDVLAFLETRGVKKEDTKTIQYSIEPRYQRFACSPFTECPPAQIVGYTVTNMIRITIRDFSEIGAIASGVVERGVNNVSGLSFGIDDPEIAQNEARAQALLKAHEKAQAIAKAGGFSLGRVLNVFESNGSFAQYARTDASMISEASAPKFEPGTEDVIINMSVTYAIDD